jgi:hypothetical protein
LGLHATSQVLFAFLRLGVSQEHIFSFQLNEGERTVNRL